MSTKASKRKPPFSQERTFPQLQPNNPFSGSAIIRASRLLYQPSGLWRVTIGVRAPTKRPLVGTRLVESLQYGVPIFAVETQIAGAIGDFLVGRQFRMGLVLKSDGDYHFCDNCSNAKKKSVSLNDSKFCGSSGDHEFFYLTSWLLNH